MNVGLLFLFRMNLYELIKKNNFQGFSIALIRRFAFSLLQCLKMLHRERIIHCDLKPVCFFLLATEYHVISNHALRYEKAIKEK